MTMKSSTRQVDGVTIVDLSGRITLGEGSVVLRDLVRDLLGKGNKKILLNLGDVTYIDSGGLGMLVFLRRWTQENGIQLKLVNPSHLVREMLDRTHLTDVFDISSVGDALEILGCTHFREQHFREHYAVAHR